MSPKMRAVTIQMRQDQVDGLARVFGRTTLRTLLLERIREFADGGLNIVEFGDGVLGIDCGSDVLVLKLQSGSKLVEQLPAFAKRRCDGGERRHIRFDGMKNPGQFFEGFADFSVADSLAQECLDSSRELKATAVEI